MVGMAILNLGWFCFKKDFWKKEEEMVRSTMGVLPWNMSWAKGNDKMGHPS
jgi:hypothetical protein